MAKYYGNVGYIETVENPTGSGIWVESITKRPYSGDVLKISRRWQSGEDKNDNLNVSILADPYANQHFHSIRYVEWMGAKWKVSEVEVEYPRLILSIGDVYNE